MSMFNISKDTPFECSINGEKIPMRDLITLHEFYNASCTAEYIHDNYGIEEKDALPLGYAIRELMVDDDISEQEAIKCVFADRGIAYPGR